MLYFSLFSMLLKKHTRIVDHIRQGAVDNHSSPDTGSETEPEQEIDYVSIHTIITVLGKHLCGVQ